MQNAGDADDTGTAGNGGEPKSNARKVPVGWPLSADWHGSRGLCVDGPAQEPEHETRCVAELDSETGRLTALRPGTVSLSVQVNGERETRRLRVVQ